MTQHTMHTPDARIDQEIAETHDRAINALNGRTEHNTTLHDLYRKECARLFTPGTSTYSTLRETRDV